MVGDTPTAQNLNTLCMDTSKQKKPDRLLKRSRTERQTLSITDLSPEPWFPKFLIIQASDENTSLAKVSPFLVAKVLEQVIGKSYQARKLNSGSIQVEVHTKQQSIALQALKEIGDTLVSVSTHRTLNIVKGVISEDELLSCSESEIEDGMNEQGVVTAKRIFIRRDGKEIPTKHIILSFKLHSLPSSIKAGYLNCNVRAYVPNPRRCFKCQRFGHSSQVCRGHPVCPKCAGKDHTPETCNNGFHCANCEGNHPVYSRSCPRWKDEKQIIRIKTEQNLTYKAAKAQLDFAKKGSFSDVVRRGVAPPRRSVETQTCFQETETPLHTPQQDVGDTQVPPTLPVANQETGHNKGATTSSKVDGAQSVWDGNLKVPSQISHSMDVDEDDCMSQKSSSSVSSLPGKEKRERRDKGRGRGSKPNAPSNEQRRPVPQRVLPP
ncbi:uncharacterized protein LOC135371790 [Ornithodoros turicata]|uniref:uncharacterized protein LOC135371790 n=1 Tax=Ornithodoros turicata TaxID=34597 RepID=UPI00313A01CA